MKFSILSRSVVVSLVFLLSLYACRKDILQPGGETEAKNFVDKKSRAWFDGRYATGNVLKTRNLHVYGGNHVMDSDTSTLNYGIDWDNGLTFYRSDSTIVEIPLIDSTLNFGVGSSPANKVIKNSITKLLIIKTPGGTRSVLMTIIANDKIANEDLSDEVALYRKNKSFSGVVIYQTMEGAFLNGFRYINGKPVGSIGVSKGLDVQSKPKGDKIKLVNPEDGDPCLVGYLVFQVRVSIMTGGSHNPHFSHFEWRDVWFIPIYEYGCHEDNYSSEFAVGDWSWNNDDSGFYYAGQGEDGPVDPCGGSVASLHITTLPPCESGGGGGGGTGGGGTTPGDVFRDTSIANNPKVECILNNLQGHNTVFDSLIAAFNGKGYNLMFRVGDIAANGSTTNPGDGPDFVTTIGRTFIRDHYQMEIAKTLLHEAFHANLSQHAYEVFGTTINSQWPKQPKDMTLAELMDQISVSTGGTSLEAIEHEYMANHIKVLARGLKILMESYGQSASSFDDDHYLGMAYFGLEETSHYKKAMKDQTVSYLGNTYTKEQYLTFKRDIIKGDAVINCN